MTLLNRTLDSNALVIENFKLYMTGYFLSDSTVNANIINDCHTLLQLMML